MYIFRNYNRHTIPVFETDHINSLATTELNVELHRCTVQLHVRGIRLKNANVLSLTKQMQIKTIENIPA